MQDFMNGASRSVDAMQRMETSNCKEALRKCGINIEEFPVAMAYVPWQKFDKMYDDLEKAYCNGTVFPELYKPVSGHSSL